MIDKNEAMDIIRQRLSPKRLEHSIQVAAVARKLAERYRLDHEKAYLTGLLHDYAKGIPSKDLLIIAEENQLIESEEDRLIPDILHAPVGACLLEKELGIEDREILKAVRLHTMGAVDMNDFDKIIFLADMLEPGRDYPGMERLNCLSMRNLDEAMQFGLDSTIKYLIDQKRLLHPRTIEVRNEFLRRIGNR
jgi:predicted HD superfamily hydrolase involved in NAD metabolism